MADIEATDPAQPEHGNSGENDGSNEESVEEERARTHENMTRMQAIVGRQEAVYNGMMKFIAEHDDDHKAQVEAASSAAKRVARPYEIEAVKVTEKGMFSPTRMYNACNVANEFVSREVRHDKFQRRKRDLVQQQNKRNQVLTRTHEASDKLAVLRQQQMKQAQQERTLVAQQKRGEAQKMLKEIHRHQDQSFEKLQLKHHPDAVSHEKATTRRKKKAPSPPPSRPGTSPVTSEAAVQDNDGINVAEEPVYRDRVKSHELYNEHLVNWRTFVAENEKRTEAHWRKILPGGKPPAKATRSSILFQRATTKICGVNDLLRKSFSMANVPSSAFECTELDLEETDSGQSPPMLSRTWSAEYPLRLERVQSHHLDLEGKAREKLENDKNFLEEKRRRGKGEVNEKAGKARETVLAWEQRNAATAAERKRMAVVTDDEIVQKAAAYKAYKDDFDRRIDEERSNVSAYKKQQALANKARALDTEEEFQERIQEKQELTNESLNKFLELRAEHHANMKGEDYQAMVAGKIAAKKAVVKAFQRSTTMEIEMKQQRHEQAKKKVAKKSLSHQHAYPMEAVQRRREVRKETPKSRSTPAELTLLPGDTLPEPFLSPEELLADHNLESPLPSPPPSPAKSPMRRSVSSSTPAPPVKLPEAADPDQKSDSDGEEREESSDSDGDRLLEDLQSRSAKWLQDLRRKSEDSFQHA